jgi:hypothetical protein
MREQPVTDNAVKKYRLRLSLNMKAELKLVYRLRFISFCLSVAGFTAGKNFQLT